MGLSTHWVFSQYSGAREQYKEFIEIQDRFRTRLDNAYGRIRQLEKENDDLKSKLKTIHSRQFKSNKKLTPGQPKRNNRGAPKGHPGWFRRIPEHIDNTVIVPAPEACPHCGKKGLSTVNEIKEHLQEDIILVPRTHVTNFKHHQAFCSKCNRPVIQLADGELANSHIGPAARSLAVFLRYGLGIPYRKVQELFKVAFAMPFVPATAMSFDRKATRLGAPIYDDLKEKLRLSMIAHADETYWRENGINHYVWYGGNNDLAFFHIDRSRSSEVATSIFGNRFEGVLNTDGYAAYNAVNPYQRQSCLAHLIRKAKEIIQQIEQMENQDAAAIGFCKKLITLFKDACRENKKIEEYPYPGKERYYSRLKKICTKKQKNKDAEAFRERLLDPNREYNRLFTFMDHYGVEPTNNQAEQSLRNLVIFRKICFGTRSKEGSYSHSVLPSLLLTAKRQGVHPLSFFDTLFSSDTATAQAALYNDSS
ncbi:MAG: IS66 family transposase [Deltaproteobacteria bacterium]|nr:MAG: IS66 family transposase [Deltaproteobacteria bacterium]